MAREESTSVLCQHRVRSVLTYSIVTANMEIDMHTGLSITYDYDNFLIKVKYYSFLNFEIDEIEFAQIAALYLSEDVSIMELCKCYQEQPSSL